MWSAEFDGLKLGNVFSCSRRPTRLLPAFGSCRGKRLQRWSYCLRCVRRRRRRRRCRRRRALSSTTDRNLAPTASRRTHIANTAEPIETSRRPRVVACTWTTQRLGHQRQTIAGEVLGRLHRPVIYLSNCTARTRISRTLFYYCKCSLRWPRFAVKRSASVWCPFVRLSVLYDVNSRNSTRLFLKVSTRE